jgi:hypothetical protein
MMSGRQLDDEEQEYWDRIREVQSALYWAAGEAGIDIKIFGKDMLVTHGRLTDLLEFTRDNRSEIEELGE